MFRIIHILFLFEANIYYIEIQRKFIGKYLIPYRKKISFSYIPIQQYIKLLIINSKRCYIKY